MLLLENQLSKNLVNYKIYMDEKLKNNENDTNISNNSNHYDNNHNHNRLRGSEMKKLHNLTP